MLFGALAGAIDVHYKRGKVVGGVVALVDLDAERRVRDALAWRAT